MSRLSLESDAADIEGMFAEFRKSYPKRRGSNPSVPALRSFARAVKRTNPQIIIDAAKVYAAEQRSLGKEGTEYVAQMATWLNQQRWKDYQRKSLPTRDLTWIPMDDPRWRKMAGRYYAEKGVLPPHVSGLGGQGWRFPTTWISEEFGGGRFAHRSSPAGSLADPSRDIETLAGANLDITDGSPMQEGLFDG